MIQNDVQPLDGLPLALFSASEGALETQRYTVDLTVTSITSHRGLYLATGITQNSTVRVVQFGIRKA